MIINNLFQESADSRPDRTKHIVMVTVTDPQGTVVTQRKEPIQRRAVVSAVDRNSAIDSAINFYKKQGYRVQDHHYVGPKDVDEGIVGDLAYKAGYGMGKVAGRGVAGYNAGKASNQPAQAQQTPAVATSASTQSLPARKAPDAFAARRAAAAKAAQDSMTPVPTVSPNTLPASPEEIRKAKQASATAAANIDMGRSRELTPKQVFDRLKQRRMAKQGVAEGAEFGAYYSEQVAQQIFDKRQDISSEEEVLNQAYHIVANDQGQKSARYMFNYDEDFSGDVVSNYFSLQKQGVAEGSQQVDSLVTDALKIMQGPKLNDAVQALKTVLGDREYNSRRGFYNFYVKQIIDMYGQQGVNEGVGDSPVAGAITRRILMQRTDLLSKYGPEKVTAAIDEVADFVGDVEEIGSSDVSGWVRHVEQMLGNMQEGVAEGEQGMSRAAKGYEKYGKAGMQALAKAGREGASEKTLDAIRDRHDNYNESLDEMRDRRDAYQRDYDSSVAGMGKRQSYAYQQDGGGNDERHDLDPTEWYIVKDGKMFKVTVYPNQVQSAMSQGFSPSREEAKAKAGLAEGLGSKLAGLSLAGAMALGSAGANARVTPDGQGGYTGGLKPTATMTAPSDNKPAAEAPKGFSKEYLQKAADPNRFGRYMISVEKAQELLKNMQEGVAEGRTTPSDLNLWNRAKIVAESKFNVYPSKQANIYANKWYQQHGGTWINGKS